MNVEAWLPIINAETCTGCGDCVEVCPTEALALQDNVAVVARPEACNYSAYCEPICPVDAIALPYLIVWDERWEADAPSTDDSSAREGA